MIHQLVTQWAQEAPIKQLCRVLDVSRSGYYSSQQRASRAPLACTDSVHARSAFEASGATYGSRRLSAALRALGLDVGRHRCRTLMKTNGLRPKWRRKFVHTTDSKHSLPVAANVLNRQFTPDKPNVAWVSDVTYIRTRGGCRPARLASFVLRRPPEVLAHPGCGVAYHFHCVAQLLLRAIEGARPVA